MSGIGQWLTADEAAAALSTAFGHLREIERTARLAHLRGYALPKRVGFMRRHSLKFMRR